MPSFNALNASSLNTHTFEKYDLNIPLIIRGVISVERLSQIFC